MKSAPLIRNPELKRKVRIELYTDRNYIEQGFGAKRISNRTGVPLSTVKDDLRYIREHKGHIGINMSSIGPMLIERMQNESRARGKCVLCSQEMEDVE